MRLWGIWIMIDWFKIFKPSPEKTNLLKMNSKKPQTNETTSKINLKTQTVNECTSTKASEQSKSIKTTYNNPTKKSASKTSDSEMPTPSSLSTTEICSANSTRPMKKYRNSTSPLETSWTKSKTTSARSECSKKTWHSSLTRSSRPCESAMKHTLCATP